VVPQELADWYGQLVSSGRAPEEMPERAWGIVVGWAGDAGHVDDDDAADIDYDDLLKQMQEGAQAANEQRRKTGYPEVTLQGWAEPPHYDRATRKLYWAKALQFGGSPRPTLNYCVRILGARGVLELNAVDDVFHLKDVSASAQLVLAKTAFTAGNRYEDFRDGIDPVAAGGVAAVVAGGVLAKKAGLLVVFAKFAKFLVLPLILLGGWIWRIVANRPKPRDPRDDLARRDPPPAPARPPTAAVRRKPAIPPPPGSSAAGPVQEPPASGPVRPE
jgi:uncharacterized membrane-anchored protein